jgi:hypothetical protein
MRHVRADRTAAASAAAVRLVWAAAIRAIVVPSNRFRPEAVRLARHTSARALDRVAAALQ